MDARAHALDSAHLDHGFRRVMCAIDGSRGSAAAVRQAIALCRLEGTVRFVSVTDVRGSGANRMASVGEYRAGHALAAARALARERGLAVDVELVHDSDVVEALLGRAQDQDLLAVGGPSGSRTGGILTGATSTAVAHRAVGAVLIARPASSPEAFPRRIVVAVSGREDQAVVAETAGRLASIHGARVDLVHLAKWDYGAETRRRLAAFAARLKELTGREPLVEVSTGATPYEIVAVARSVMADLVILGRRGLRGIRALDSVSESVVHHAPCSVLVVPSNQAPQ